jgi:N-acetylglutamate synthase-like GNAT family acetyltransferase
MIIRAATANDIEGILMLGEAMFKESQFAQYDFDKDKVTDQLHSLIDQEDSLLLIATQEDELLAGFAAKYSEHWFGKCMVSFDILFFIAPKSRGSIVAKRLITKYIEWAKVKQVDEILLGNSTGGSTESTDRFFQLMGFHRIGGNYRLANGS